MWDKNVAISPNKSSSPPLQKKAFVVMQTQSASENLVLFCARFRIASSCRVLLTNPSSCEGYSIKKRKKLYYNHIMGTFHQFRRRHENVIKKAKKKSMLLSNYKKKQSNCYTPILKSKKIFVLYSFFFFCRMNCRDVDM